MYVMRKYVSNFSIRKKTAEWRKLKVKTDSVVIEVSDKARLKLYTDSVLSETIFVGRFENAELDFVKRYLRKDDVFLDIGANVGLFTVVAGVKVGEKGHVFSFEPVSQTFSRLDENVRINGLSNVSLFNAGLSDADGELEITTSGDGYDAWNSFGIPTAGTDFTKEKVKTTRLDTWVAQHHIPAITMAKIDVEGWEYNVLAGGESFFSSEDAPDLLVEFTEQNCLNAGFTCATLYDRLASYGYTMYMYDEAEKKLIPEPKRKTYTHMNIVATKKPERVSHRIR